ncbi:MAG: YraN family protein [Bacillota bacterium]|jgi:putative endonuclease
MNIFDDKKTFGTWGEQLAADYLQNAGYEIVCRNYRCRYGELDLVCREGGVWCFVEVKVRRSTQYGNGLQAITASKKRHLRAAARVFLNQRNDADGAGRFDIVAIQYHSVVDYEICLVQNAF